MKKTIILFSFITIFCLSTFMFGAYIITTPAQGDKWEKTGIHAIKWIKLGDKTEKVNLYLYDKTGKNKIMTIVEEVKNTGEYYCNFNIFNKVPEGEYKVFIISQKGKILGNSKLFKIFEMKKGHKIIPFAEEKLKVKTPALKIEVRQGKTLNLQWESKENLPINFLIELFDGNKIRKIRDIGRLLPPAMGLSVKPVLKKIFNYNWVIPADIPPGKYYIKISAPDKNIHAFSPMILINIKENFNIHKREKIIK